MPFRAETIRSYVAGISQVYLAEEYRRRGLISQPSPINVETRFRYNQAFKSVYSIIPGVIMLILMLIPAMLTAVGVVREKEVGSIANFRSTPVTRAEFLHRQAGPLRAALFLELLSAAGDGASPVRPSCARLGAGADRRRLPLCLRNDFAWHFVLVLPQHAGRGHFRHRYRLDHSDGQFLRPARAGLFSVRRRALNRPRLSQRHGFRRSALAPSPKASISRRSAPISPSSPSSALVYQICAIVALKKQEA